MGYEGIIGLDYESCEIILNKLNMAIRTAEMDLEHLAAAGNYAAGCRSRAGDSIEAAKRIVDKRIEDTIKFRQEFQDYYNEVQEFDHKFAMALNGGLNEQNKISSFLTPVCGFGSTGKGGIAGTVRDTYRALSTSCAIVQRGDYYVIKGMADKRKGIELLQEIRGTKYKIGSAKFIEAGLDRYLPKGFSLEEGLSKAKTNIKPNVKSGFENFGKNTFLKDSSKIGNAAKALGYAGIAVDTVDGIYENIENGETKGTKYAADISADVVKGLGGMAAGSACAEIGFAIGTAIPIPVVGSVAGLAAGFAVGYVGCSLYNTAVDGVEIGGKTAAGWLSALIENALDKGKEELGI